MIEQRRTGSRVIMKFIKHGDRIYTGASKNNLPLINGSCRWKIHRGERYEAREGEQSLLPVISIPFLLFLFIFFFHPQLRSPFSKYACLEEDLENVDEFLAVGNERFTSEIRTARRKSISAASMIVLLIPRATLSGRENCKLPVYDISYGVRMYAERRGEKNRNHNPRHQSQFLCFLSWRNRCARRYPISEKIRGNFEEGERKRENFQRGYIRMDFGRTCIARGRHVRPRY